MPTYFAEGIAPDQMNTIWKNAPLCKHCAVLFDTCGNSSPFPPSSMEGSAQDNCVQGERGWKK